MKKVMILTAERTGTGHKSAANAIEKRLNNLDYETKQVDCFTMMGKLGQLLENSYIPLTTRCPILFYIPFLFSQAFPNAVHGLMYLLSKRSLKKEIDGFNPDLIITVHSMFTKSISHYIKKEKLDIPFYVDVIDLVNPPKVWIDKNADVTFVPTIAIKEDYIKKGFDESKLFVSGFPIRDDITKRESPKMVEDKVNILLVNPSVNLKKNVNYVKEVSKLDNASVSVICGRDKRMYKTLTKRQEDGIISKDVKIYSFITNMNEMLENAHIILAKAGPNMILESEKSGSAIVVTGHIKGQENRNYEYVIDNHFGFKCEDPEMIYDELNRFISSTTLNECLTNVLKSNCHDGAELIANYIDEHL